MLEIVGSIVILAGTGYLVVTLILARERRPVPVGAAAPDHVMFLVPALDEELVIGNTIESLLAACGTKGRILVIDDGSTDRTADVVRSYGDPRVLLHQRIAPDARKGKGAALNDAYRRVRDDTVARGIDPSSVVLGIVDADGRLQRNVLSYVSAYFRGPRVGGLQLLVRIRNRESWLGRFQDFEFLVFSSLTQTAREKLGSVGLGGNGQFTRLAALMDLGDEPWTDCLTEDLDLGIRLAIAGWEHRFCGRTAVDQQGLTSLRLLLRQRTRWAQGHFQCWSLVPRIVRSDLPTVTVFDLCYYLLAPGLILLYSVIFSLSAAATLVVVASDPARWMSPLGAIIVLLMYVLSMGPGLLIAQRYRRGTHDLSRRRMLVLAHLLPIYNYVWYVAEWRALYRIVRGRKGWAKTARHAEAPVADVAVPSHA